MEIEQLRVQYAAQRPLYERLTKKLEPLLRDLLAQADIPLVYISARTKELGSLIETMKRKEYSRLDELEDVSGLHIVVLRQDLVPRVVEVVNRQFDVVKSRDAAAELGTDRVGYRSKHLIIRLRAERLAQVEWGEFEGLQAEVQVLSELEDVFARTGRELRHKLGLAIPAELDRSLNVLSGVLESADASLSILWIAWQDFIRNDLDRLVRDLGSAPTEQGYKRLLDISTRLHAKHRHEFAETNVRSELVREHPSFELYLDHHFATRRLTIGGRHLGLMQRNLATGLLRIPVAVIWAGDVRLGTVETNVVRENPDWSRSRFVIDQLVRERVLGNNLTFEARSITTRPDHVEISGGLTTYASALIAQDGLEAELLSAAALTLGPGDNSARFSTLSKKLTDRAIAESTGNPFEGANRFNAIAISTLIVAPGEDDGYVALFQRRSKKTAAHAGLFHVIPAAMFQPDITFPRPDWEPKKLPQAAEEWDWRLNVVREYGEELFSESLKPPANSIDQITSTTPHTYALARALASGQVLLEATGLVVNATNYRPEICTVLLIQDAAWWREESKHLKLNWEHETQDPASVQSSLRSLRLSNFETDFVEACGGKAGTWVPPGLAALWLGVEFVKRHLATQAAEPGA